MVNGSSNSNTSECCTVPTLIVIYSYMDTSMELPEVEFNLRQATLTVAPKRSWQSLIKINRLTYRPINIWMEATGDRNLERRQWQIIYLLLLRKLHELVHEIKKHRSDIWVLSLFCSITIKSVFFPWQLLLLLLQFIVLLLTYYIAISNLCSSYYALYNYWSALMFLS